MFAYVGLPQNLKDLKDLKDLKGACVSLSGNKYFYFKNPKAISSVPLEIFSRVCPLKKLGTPSDKTWKVFA